MKKFNTFLATALIAILVSVGPFAMADETNQAEGLSDLTPAAAAEQDMDDVASTHPVLRMTPDKSELVYLDRDAASVVVGNPDHLGVMLDTPRVLILAPRAAGASYFTVLDQNREIIMQRHVIIASPKEKYVRVRRSCAGSDAAGVACAPTSVYYCPDMCHEISLDQGQNGSNN